MSTHQTPEPPSDAASQLQRASQRISRQRAQWAQFEEEFGHIVGLLNGKIMTNAPNCELKSSEDGWEWRRSDVVLRVAPVQPTRFPVTDFEDTYIPLSDSFYPYRSSFSVEAESSIAVIDGNSNGKSYGLWYCEAQEPTIFGWYGVYSNNTKMIPAKEDFVDSCVNLFARIINLP